MHWINVLLQIIIRFFFVNTKPIFGCLYNFFYGVFFLRPIQIWLLLGFFLEKIEVLYIWLSPLEMAKVVKVTTGAVGEKRKMVGRLKIKWECLPMSNLVSMTTLMEFINFTTLYCLTMKLIVSNFKILVEKSNHVYQCRVVAVAGGMVLSGCENRERRTKRDEAEKGMLVHLIRCW